MADLVFNPLAGKWRNGNDFANVEVTTITGPPGVSALLYTCFVNIDYDGAANAYGPRDKTTLDQLEDAGYPDWWYAVLAVHPKGLTGDYCDDSKAKFNVGTWGQSMVKYFDLELDDRYADSMGRQPVKRKSGDYKGYFLSATGKNRGGYKKMYEPSSYLDAASDAYGALSGDLQTIGNVQTNDCGLAIRHNQPKQCAFFFADPGATSGEKAHAVGECSYKLFLELGGPEKTPRKTPNNNFFVSYLAFPRSGGGDTPNGRKTAIRNQLDQMSKADNSHELPLLMAFAGKAGGGKSGLDGLLLAHKQMASKTVPTMPDNYANIAIGLAANGFRGDVVSMLVGGAAALVAP